MRILLTTFSCPPNADGIAHAAGTLATGLARRGHEVTIATAPHPKRTPEVANSNPHVRQFNLSGEGYFDPEVERGAYRDFLQSFEGDVILFECWDRWNTLLAMPLLKQLKPKKILISHGYNANVWERHPKFAWGLGAWLRRLPFVVKTPFLMRRFDQLVVLSQSKRWNRFFDHWIAGATFFKRCSVIPNGINMQEFEASLPDFRNTFKIGAGPLFLCVANYFEHKNQAMALRAFRHAGIDEGTLVLIGSEFNEYSRKLQAEDAELKRRFLAGKVLFLEKVSREMTCAAYKAADVFVLSAKAETQPIVLLEAMASKTPFISTDTGCVAELPGGLIARSETEITARMKELIASAEKRQKLGREGWEACRATYNWERVIEQYERLLFHVTASNRGDDLVATAGSLDLCRK